jgi:hypothetical protein
MNNSHANIVQLVAAAEGDSKLVDQLSQSSSPYQDPLTHVRWASLNQDSFWLPQQAISLYGCDHYETLSEAQRKKLSQLEFLSFTEAGIWLESLFMERIGRAMIKPKQPLSELIYHLHELREEAGHSLMFLELIRRSAPLAANTHFHRLDLSNLLARYAPFESILFWTAVLMGEEIPDRMNRFVRKHGSEVNPAIHDICSIHITDEARHIAHAKDTLAKSLSKAGPFQRKLLSHIVQRMLRQFVRTFYLPSQHIYQQAGLAAGENWTKLAANNPEHQQFIRQCTEPTIHSLREYGLVLEWESN